MRTAAALLLLFALLGAQANAYEQATHAAITDAALLASEIGGARGTIARLVRELGIDTYRPIGSSQYYYEFVDTLTDVVPYVRKVQPFERLILNNLRIDWQQNPIQAWILYGTIREDDNPSEDPPTPQDVTTGLIRPLNHFWDPYRDRPLDVPLLSPDYGDTVKNVDWATGARNSFSNLNTPAVPRRNHFTIFDAREAMFRALTLKTRSAGAYVDISGGSINEKQDSRERYWATALRSLGNVLHLNQDMAQPQHTRNEAHSGKYCPLSWLCASGHTSVYEKYMKARTLNEGAFYSFAPFNTSVPFQAPSLPLIPSTIPQLSTYADYWGTSPGIGSLQGKGLADYSSRGFFTAAKNFGTSEYPSPTSNPADYAIRNVTLTKWDGSAVLDSAVTKVYFGQVVDTLDGSSALDVPLTTFGVWDQFLQKKSKTPKYSLNRLNYDAMADLLLPRAVAYSAGLINYFFRGKIDISLPSEGVFAVADHGVDSGFKKLRVKIKNNTTIFTDAQGNALLQAMSGGTFFAVIRYHKDRQYASTLDTIVGVDPCDEESSVVNLSKADATSLCRDGVEQIVVSEPLTGESLSYMEEKTVEFKFTGSPMPYAMTDVVLQIVYRGPLGSEADAVAVGTLDISEPTYFTYQNASDYIHIGEHVHTRAEINASPELLSLVRPQYCVDYRQSPARLYDVCFRQFDLDLVVGFQDLATPLAEARGIPPRHLMRIVYLTTADDAAGTSAKSAERRKLRASAQPHAELEKALLNQQGTCLPFDPFDIPSRHSQLTMLSSTEPTYRLGLFNTLRGVNGWFSTSCVVNGDQSQPGATDDRNTTMSDLAKDTDEVRPVPVTIMSLYQ